MAYYIGYDLGSSSVKAALVDASSGQSIGITNYPENEMKIISLETGWAEQQPEFSGDGNGSDKTAISIKGRRKNAAGKAAAEKSKKGGSAHCISTGRLQEPQVAAPPEHWALLWDGDAYRSLPTF